MFSVTVKVDKDPAMHLCTVSRPLMWAVTSKCLDECTTKIVGLRHKAELELEAPVVNVHVIGMQFSSI